jgi:hypothetical protein
MAVISRDGCVLDYATSLRITAEMKANPFEKRELCVLTVDKFRTIEARS